MEIRTGVAMFANLRDSGPFRRRLNFDSFSRPIRQLFTGLTGYTIGFRQGFTLTDKNDHPLGRLNVKLENWTFHGPQASVDVLLGLRDWSGDWDDVYEGTVSVAAIAELEPAPATPPASSDLSIVGIEFTQVIQSFQSARHLDPPNVRPDNAIPLVAGKPTTARVYINYTGPRPETELITGLLEVTSAAGTWSSPLRGGPVIRALRAEQINRGLVEHSLNFRIPDEHCRGTVTVRCQVAAELSSSLSPRFETRAAFRPIPRFNLRVVPFNVRTPNQDHQWSTAGPFSASMVIPELLQRSERLLPVDRLNASIDAIVQQVTTTERTDDGGLAVFNRLLDQLIDLRGDSSDILLGLFRGGISFGPVGGLSDPGRKVVGAFADGDTGPASIVHELGHVFGRHHTPSENGSRVDRDNTVDEHYPAYASFARGSIGEFGFEPQESSSAQVKNPARFLDVMTTNELNRNGVWISPYTYLSLMRTILGMSTPKFDVPRKSIQWDPDGSFGCFQFDPDSQVGQPKIMTLFLRLMIGVDGTVSRQPSFHFPANAEAQAAEQAAYWLEFRDADDKSLATYPLTPVSTGAWPLTFRAAVPYPTNARALNVWQGAKRIYHENIPDPPKIKVTTEYLKTEGVFSVKWSAAPQAGKLWYLVHWQDDDGMWRGLAPRTQDTSLLIPNQTFSTKREVKVRVLATSGIATGSTEVVLHRPDEFIPSRPRLLIYGEQVGADAPILRAALITGAGRVNTAPDALWYDDHGQQIGRGPAFELGRLPAQTTVLHVSALAETQAVAGRSLKLEGKGDDLCFKDVTEEKNSGGQPPTAKSN